MPDNIMSLTQPAVMAHPNLFEARAFGKKGKESGTPKFSANLVQAADSPDLAMAKKIAVEVARARWPGRSLAELKFPFSNGTKLADKRKVECEAAKKTPDGEYQRGKVVIAARSKFEPALSVLENGRITDLEGPARLAAKGKFYFGVEVLAELSFVAYEGVGANPDGVTCYLQKVCSLNKGTKIAGNGTSAAETFKGYTGHYTAENPAAGDEITS